MKLTSPLSNMSPQTAALPAGWSGGFASSRVTKHFVSPTGAMLVIGLLALSAEALMSRVEKRLLAWRPPSLSEGSKPGV